MDGCTWSWLSSSLFSCVFIEPQQWTRGGSDARDEERGKDGLVLVIGCMISKGVLVATVLVGLEKVDFGIENRKSFLSKANTIQ